MKNLFGKVSVAQDLVSAGNKGVDLEKENQSKIQNIFESSIPGSKKPAVKWFNEVYTLI